MRLHIAAAVAALALLVILAQSAAMLMLFDEKEEEFITALLSQQIAHSMAVWPSAPVSAFPNTPDMQLYRRAKGLVASEIPAWVAPLAVGNHEIVEAGREYHVAVRDDPSARYFLVYDVQDHERRRREIMLMTLTAACFLALLALAAGYALAGRLAGRLERLAGRLSADDAGPLAEPGMERELRAVAEALDGYRQRQAEVLERERTFAANLSHELRTPLTAIRTDAELLAALPNVPDAVVRRANRVIGGVDRINRLSSSLLLLARDAKPALPEEIRLRPALAAVWEALRLASPKPVELRLELPPECTLYADPALLELVLRNVLDNALRYSTTGDIVCRLQGSVLAVIDHGPGFAEADLPRVFDRFFTGPQGAHGLGLALVRHVGAACGWQVGAANRPEGGAELCIDFGADLTISSRTVD